MKFEEVLPALREGKKITCSFIKKDGNQYIYYEDETIRCDNKDCFRFLTDKEIVESDDWEIVKEPKKVKLRDLTEEQYKKWFDDNCAICVKCEDCPFQKISCMPNFVRCWVKNKEFYDDKFLDQEIEIED